MERLASFSLSLVAESHMPPLAIGLGRCGGYMAGEGWDGEGKCSAIPAGIQAGENIR
jgi:uncharacterized low-complexity protein